MKGYLLTKIDSKYLPNGISYPELQNLHNKFKAEVRLFLKRNIFNLEKTVIDNKILSDRNITKNYVPHYLTSWSSINSLPLLHRYYSLYERTSILKNINSINENCIPLRLWDIDYQIDNNCYFFINFAGEKIELKGIEKYLWEMATGEYSIKDIITFSDSPFENNEDSKRIVIEFFIKLYNSFALVFSEY